MEIDRTKSMLWTLREAKRVEADVLVGFNLGLIADELQAALTTLGSEPTPDNLTRIVSKWAHGVRMLNFAGKRGKPGGKGGALSSGAELAAQHKEAA